MSVLMDEFYGYAKAHFNGGNLKEASDAFKVLCMKHPYEKQFWIGFAASEQKLGRYEGALHAWAVAALLSPDDPRPHFRAAECYFSLGVRDDGLMALTEASERLGADDPLSDEIEALKTQWDSGNGFCN
ncbi:MAG: type secretion specific chlamydia chaperone 2 [Chlamydiota bacterium]|jgi:type III secretion system low calcium response chaperone LcrH/SycD